MATRRRRVSGFAEGSAPRFFEGQSGADGILSPFASLFFCKEKGRYFHPPCPRCGRPLALCVDDAVLAAAGLPLYSRSLERHLYCEACAGSSARELLRDGSGERRPPRASGPDQPRSRIRQDRGGVFRRNGISLPRVPGARGMFRPLPEGAGPDRPVLLLPVPRVRLRRDVPVRSRFSRAPFRGRGGGAGEAAGIRGGTREGGVGARGGGRGSAPVRARGTQVPRDPLPQALPPRGTLRRASVGGESCRVRRSSARRSTARGSPSAPPGISFPGTGISARCSWTSVATTRRRLPAREPRVATTSPSSGGPGSRRSSSTRNRTGSPSAAPCPNVSGARRRRKRRRFPAHGIRDPRSSRGTSSSNPRRNRCPVKRRRCGTTRSPQAGRFSSRAPARERESRGIRSRRRSGPCAHGCVTACSRARRRRRPGKRGAGADTRACGAAAGAGSPGGDG